MVPIAANTPLVPTVMFESNGLRGADVHTTSTDAPKQVGLPAGVTGGLGCSTVAEA